MSICSSKKGHLNLQENGKLIPVRVEVADGVISVKKPNEVVRRVSLTMEAFDERTVTLRKVNNKIGITFTGGFDHDKLVTISKINKDSPADCCGNIKLQDVLLHVNEVPVLNIKHDDIKEIIMSTNETITFHLVSLCLKEENKKGVETFDLQSVVGEDNAWVKYIDIDLAMSHLTQYYISRNKLRSNGYEISSPSVPALVLLCAQDQVDTLNEWTKCISENIIHSNRQQVENLLDNFDLYNLICFGWTSELLSSSKSISVWTKKFLVLRQEKLEIYAKAPENAREWQNPEVSYGICDITWKVLRSGDMLETDYRPYSILLTSGTGVRHIISFEFCTVLNYWKEQLTAEVITVVNKIKERTFKAKWNDSVVNFTIDLRLGFVITNYNTNELLWNKPFSKLKHSSDDGCSILHLEFTGSDIQDIHVKELQCAVFTIEAFLKTKVAEIGVNPV